MLAAKRGNVGWCGRLRDPEKALRWAGSVELLDRSALRVMFPEATIWSERWLGLTKSLVAYGGALAL